MAITSSSNSTIEILLKHALEKENIKFEEQYKVYENTSDLSPKYVIDFLVSFGEKSIAVECDGFSYHVSDFDVDNEIMRDRWLQQQGYGKVLHFTTYQLKYEMEKVLLNIKHYLGMETVPPEKLKFKGKKRRTAHIENVTGIALHEVLLYYSYTQVADKVWIAYKFKDNTLNKFSEERIKLFSNVPEKQGNALSLYIALSDLKKSTKLTVYCLSGWLTSYFNQLIPAKDKKDAFLLKKIDTILNNHNYIFRYLNTYREPEYYYDPSEERLIVYELHNRCLQLRNNCSSQYNHMICVDFNSLQ